MEKLTIHCYDADLTEKHIRKFDMLIAYQVNDLKI